MQIVGQYHAVGQNPSLSALNHANIEVSKVSRVWNMAKPWISKVMEMPQLKEIALSLMPIEVVGVATLIKAVSELENGNQQETHHAIGNTIKKYVPSIVIDALGKVAISTLAPVMAKVHHGVNRVREKITGREDLSFEKILLLNEGERMRAITTVAISPVVEESLTQGMRELSILATQLAVGFLTDLSGIKIDSAVMQSLAVNLGHVITQLFSTIGPEQLALSYLTDLSGIKIDPTAMQSLAVNLGHVITQLFGIVGSAITFGLAHENNIDSENFRKVFVPGLMYSLMYTERGLFSAIATHSLYNISLIIKDLIIPRLQEMQGLGQGVT